MDELKKLLHELIDAVPWPSHENRADAHQRAEAVTVPSKEGPVK